MNAMPEGLSAALRRQAAEVMAAADFVTIRREAVDAYSASLLARYSVITKADAAHHFVSADAPEQTAAYMLALDSINFGSGYFGVAQDNGLSLEYIVIAEGLKKAFEAGDFNTPARWMEMAPDDFHRLFGIPAGRSAALDELMRLFARHLQASGEIISGQYGGKVMNLLAAAGHSAGRLVDIVGCWPTFRDVAAYKGREVPFYKRAQILAADMSLAFGGAAPADFGDMAALTCFSDNMVPHVLRHDGLVSYAPDLANRIDSGIEIPAGSAEEVEIRAAGIHAVELIRAASLKAGRNVTSVNIDHILWNRGYETALYAKPSHKTRTVWY